MIGRSVRPVRAQASCALKRPGGHPLGKLHVNCMHSRSGQSFSLNPCTRGQSSVSSHCTYHLAMFESEIACLKENRISGVIGEVDNSNM